MKNFVLVFFALLNSIIVNSQVDFSAKSNYNGKIQVTEKSRNCGYRTRVEWDNLKPEADSKNFTVNVPKGFTCFGMGWTSDNNVRPNDVIFQYRFFTASGWSEYFESEGYISPKETPTKMYWTDLNFTSDQEAASKIEFKVSGSVSSITSVTIDLYNIEKSSVTIVNEYENVKACPHRPYVIPRSVWLDPYYTQPPYTSTIISPTHTVIHHGASPNTYTDGASVVRSYWNYHVNSNGWSDIGYNYLFDKYGNAYQGRQNSSPLTQDVNGAHAGASNPYSLGINFLGNADVTLPTTIQIDTVLQFLAWWYNWRGYDPTSSATLILQSGGSASVPRILGHKDTNIGGTACPGTTLYADLPSFRTGTKAIIDACSGSTGPTNLASSVLGCPDNNVQFSWQNSGSGWYIQLSSTASFTNPYMKWVSGITTYTGPAGFVLQSDGITPLVLLPSTTYYWRIWDGTAFFNGGTFVTLNCDNIAPTTTIASPNNWKTSDFTATFTDNDNLNVEKAFYQILDFDGTYWSANATHGFFADNFDVLHSTWTNYTGTWNANTGQLIQTDQVNANTNIYAALDQNLSNRYLYQFKASASGTGSGRRFGFHFFCDNGALANRGNSYFVWFRIDDQSLQFYKVENDVFTLVSTVTNVVTTPGQLYDYKVSYDRITGIISVWRDDIFLGNWTDSAPYLTNGNYISFRTGACALNVDEIKVFRSRYPSVTVTLNDATKDIRYQNPNPATYGAKIKSIVVDGNNNLSAIAYHDLNIDWTPPTEVSVIDGATTDTDTMYTTSTASFEWSVSSDPNSGVAEYWYALGNAPGATDVVTWTNNGILNNVTLNGLNLSIGSQYYFSVKAKNNAELWSNVITSDGFIVSTLTVPVADFYVFEDTIYLPSANALFFNTSQNSTSYLWDFGDGTISTSTNPWHNYTQTGIYNVRLVAMSSGLPNDTMVKNNYVYVLNPGSINYVSKNIVSVYPNPFSDEVRIEFSDKFSGSVTLIDAVGRKVTETKINNVMQYTLGLTNSLDQGIYILKLTKENGENSVYHLMHN